MTGDVYCDVTEYRGDSRLKLGSLWLHDGEDIRSGMVWEYLERVCAVQMKEGSFVVALEQGESGPVLDAWLCENGVIVHEEGRCDRTRLSELAHECEGQRP